MRMGLPLCAMLLLAMPWVVGQAPTADLSVTSITIVGPAPQWINGTVEDARLATAITNHGDVPLTYSITYYWTVVSESSYLNGDRSSSTDVIRQALAPGQSVIQEATWFVRPDQRGNGGIVAVLSSQGDQNPGNDVFTQPTAVPVHDLHIVAPAPLGVHFDEMRFTRFKVENRGTHAETVDVEVLGGNPRLQVTIEPRTLQLPPGGQGLVTLVAELPFSGDTSPVQADVRLASWGSTDPRVFASSDALPIYSDASAYDPAAYAATLEAAPTLGVGMASASTEVTLRNTGSAPDSYRLEASFGADCGPASSQWAAQTDDALTHLVPGASRILQIRLVPEIPPVPGSREVLRLCARSVHPFVALAEATQELQVDGPRLVVSFEGLPERFRLSDDALFAVRVANKGNQASAPGNISVAIHGPAGDQQVLYPVPAIAAGASRLVPVELRLGAAPGMVGLEASWVSPGLVATIDDSAQVPLGGSGLALVMPEPSQGVPGERVNYLDEARAIRVVNLGDTAESVRLSAVNASWVRIHAEAVTIPAGESRAFGAAVDIPLPYAPSTLAAQIQAKVVDAPHIGVNGTLLTRVADGRPPSVTLMVPGHATSEAPVHARGTFDDDVAIKNATLFVDDGQRVARYGLGTMSPYDLPLSLGPGAYNVLVTVSDTAGRTASTSHHIVKVSAQDRTYTFSVPAEPLLVGIDTNFTVHGGPRPTLNVTVAGRWQPVDVQWRDGNWSTDLKLASLSPGTYNLSVVALGDDGWFGATEFLVTVAAPAVHIDPVDGAKQTPFVGWLALAAVLILGRRRAA